MHLAHVPTPYSTANSSIATVVAELSREHALAGGTTSAVVSQHRNLRIPWAENILVDYTETCPREWFDRRELAIDILAGRTGFRRPYYGRLQRPAMERLREIAPDAVILHDGHYGAAALPLWRQYMPDSRIVLYVHNTLSASYSKRETRRLLGGADLLIFGSTAAMEKQEFKSGRFPTRTAVVHPGVNRDVFRRTTDRRSSPFIVTYAGQVAAHKGVKELIYAFANAELRDSKLIVAGSGSYDSEAPLDSYEVGLRELSGGLGVNVEYRPFMPQQELAALFNESALVCVPSLCDEAFGMVVTQAMACGASVIASDRGGLREAGGDAATYVNPSDVSGFAEAIRAHSSLEFLAERRGRAIAHASQYTWRASYDDFMDALRSI